MSVKHNKGKINDNAYAALVRSDVFKPKKENPKKGKGSYKRTSKHKNKGYSRR
jgi:alternative ribosome-rescue factor